MNPPGGGGGGGAQPNAEVPPGAPSANIRCGGRSPSPWAPIARLGNATFSVVVRYDARMATEAYQPTAFGWKRQLRVRTGDDITLCVERIAPSGPCQGAVILCHGLASNGMVFDLPGRSLARYLAEHGLECFIPDLRGARYSSAPSGGWCLDDYLEQDLPALLQLVREQALSEQVHWVGHSLGGILCLMYASERPEAPLSRVVTIGSSLDYRPGNSVYQQLRKALPLVRPVNALPFSYLTKLSAAVSNYVQLTPERMNFYRPNIEADVVRSMLQDGFGPIPTGLLRDLSSTFTAGGFARRGGLLRYEELWPRYRLPTLLLVGSRDPQCNIAAVDETIRLIGHVEELEVRPLGREFGHQEDYGHFDLILGRNAKQESWPLILNWLQRS